MAGCATQPKPFDQKQHLAFASARLALVTLGQEPLAGGLTLYDAMARALKYNLDAKVEIMESALKLRELRLADYSMVPRLVAGTGYAGRSRSDASSPSLRDADIVTADLGFTWNILDFGLSYVRAQQAADDVLIQEEKKRKVVNRIIEDVRTAYWRAASYERLVDRLRGLEGRVKGALRDTRKLAGGGDTSPLVALTYERELIQVQRQIEKLEGELKVAKSQLAALVNISPGSEFRLIVPTQRPVDLGLPKDPSKLYEIAAANRPEMREIAYELRVNEREVDAAMLELLPNFNFYAGPNYDSNKFIQTNDWVSYGAKVSWNLMKLLAMPAVQKKIEAQDDLLEKRSLSVAMAIMTQIHVSLVRHDHLKKSYDTARQLAGVQHKIVRQVKAETDAQRTSEQILIREEMNTLVADAEMDMVYADLQNAYANVYASLGIDPFPPGMSTSESVSQIAAELQAMWFERGEKLGDKQIHAAAARPVTITGSIPAATAPISAASAAPAPQGISALPVPPAASSAAVAAPAAKPAAAKVAAAQMPKAVTDAPAPAAKVPAPAAKVADAAPPAGKGERAATATAPATAAAPAAPPSPAKP